MKPTPKFKWEDIDRLHMAAGISSPHDPGFTILEYAEHYTLNSETARHRLAKMVKAGMLAAGWRMISSESGKRRARVYTLVSLARGHRFLDMKWEKL